MFNFLTSHTKTVEPIEKTEAKLQLQSLVKCQWNSERFNVEVDEQSCKFSMGFRLNEVWSMNECDENFHREWAISNQQSRWAGWIAKRAEKKATCQKAENLRRPKNYEPPVVFPFCLVPEGPRFWRYKSAFIVTTKSKKCLCYVLPVANNAKFREWNSAFRFHFLGHEISRNHWLLM